MALSLADADATVWNLVLQHCCETPWPYGAQKLICTLLQVSKGLQQAVARQFQGQMYVAATIKSLQQAESFARWLSNPCMAFSGHVISELWLEVNCKGDNMQAEMLIAAALQSDAGAPDAVPAPGPTPMAPVAAVPCHKLLVGEFSTTTPSIVISRSLAAGLTQLTSMSLDFISESSLCALWTQESMLELGKAIGRLSSLRDLQLSGYEYMTEHQDGDFFIGCDFLVNGLSSLTALTSLDMQEVATTNDLPAHLRELTYNCFDIDLESTWSFYYKHRSDSPAFAELTALTKLEFRSGTYVKHALDRPVRRMIDIASMPPYLLELDMPGNSRSEAVLQCKHLTRLVLEGCEMQAEELQSLTSLGDLREIRLSHRADGLKRGTWLTPAADAARAWNVLPIKSLRFEVDLRFIIKHDAESDDISLYAAAMGHDSRRQNMMLLDKLALQTGLTRLELDAYFGHPEVFEQLGLLHAPLQHLTNLKELDIGLANHHYYSLSTRLAKNLRIKIDGKICKGLALVCHVIAALPELTMIKLNYMPIAFARHMKRQLLANNSKSKLCINPKLELDAD